VCVIVLNWNGLEDTIECVESLRKVTYPAMSVLVVDNGSEGHDASELRRRFGDSIDLIENDKNYGFAEGNNIGIRYALEQLSPDYVLLLNNDTVVDPEFLSELVRSAESDHSIGIVGPKVLFYHEPSTLQSAGGTFNWWTGQASLIGCTQIDTGQFDVARDVDWVIGCALLAKASVIRKIGLLYEGYFCYREEVDWCARCKGAGYAVRYVPKASIWHKRRLATNRIDEFRLYHMTRNQFLLMKRNAKRLQFACFVIQFGLVWLPVTPLLLLIRQRDFKLIMSFYKGVADGIKAILGGTVDRCP